jgi:FKBP-type peptidyl-prolyl cis-trans isomerase
VEESNKKTQVLIPALAAGAVVVLIVALVAMSDWTGTAKPTGKAPAKNVSGSTDDEGMSDSIPSLEGDCWKTLPSGIRVCDAKVGEGDPVPAGATVTIHYTGWLTDGKVFDNSRMKAMPATFPLNNLIAGWQQGIPGMKPGGIRRLEIPSNLGYGDRGSPPDIPPKATLVFEIKLLSWK